MGWFHRSSDVVEHSDSQLEDLFNLLVLNTGGLSGALGVAAIHRARSIIADTLSSLPLTSGDSLVPAPNQRQDWQQFLAESLLSMQDHGDVYWHLTDGGLFVLEPDEMQIKWSEWTGFRRSRLFEFRSLRMRESGLAKNLHVVSMNRGVDDLSGFGWMESDRVAGIVAIDKYSQEYFENNAMPAGIMSVPSEPTKDEAKLIKAQVAASQKARSLMIKPKTWDFEASSFSPNDSQWVDSHLVSIGDVANLSGVPAFLLQYNPPGSTQQYENVEALLIRLWRETLFPMYAKRLQEALTEVLEVQVKFDPQTLFTTSLLNRSIAAKNLVEAGYDADGVADVTDFEGLPAAEVVDVPVLDMEDQDV